MSTQTFTPVTKFFHWTTALLVIPLFPLGGIAHDLPQGTNDEIALKALLFSIHKTLGVTVFFVALLRILWAVTHERPGPLHPDRKAETLLAEVIHWILYISLVITPLSGWIHHAATAGFAPIWWPFGQSLPLVPKDETVAHLFGAIHGVVTKVMVASILLHIAGALKHQFVDRDATLRRMWFGNRDLPQVQPHHSLAAPLLAALVTGGAVALGALLAQSDDHGSDMATTALEQVASDWQVTDGTLAITVRQLGSDVIGQFADWTAQIAFDPDAGPDFGTVTTTIAIGSLSLGSVTDQAMGPDFFDASQFPTATFTGPITATDTGYQVAGTLTLKGTSAPLTLPFDLDLAGDSATMSGQVTVDRQTFGIGASMPDETNLGFAVVIDVALTATRNQP